MAFPLFLNLQYRLMLERKNALVKANVGLNINKAIKCVNETKAVYAEYQQLTKTFIGRVLSFLPGAKAFESRIKCVRSISAAFNELASAKKWQDDIGEPYFPVVKKEPPTKSNEKVLPRCHPSPIKTPRASQAKINYRPSQPSASGLTAT